MKYILNISIYLSLHAMISMWSVFYTYTQIYEQHRSFKIVKECITNHFYLMSEMFQSVSKFKYTNYLTRSANIT